MTDIDKIRNHLVSRPRDLLLFEFILQTKLPVKSLLALKMADIKNLAIGDELPLQNSKNTVNKSRPVTPEIYAAVKTYQKAVNPKDSDFLFKSRKGNGPLSIPSVSRIIKSWTEETGLTQLKGLHGFRQTHQKNVLNVENLADGPKHILPKVKSKTVQEIVYKELEDAILSGRIRPGQKIVTEEISRMMDVSRIPVREAMGRLEAKGLIKTRPKWGSIVNMLSSENLKEISEIRILLEPKAAVRAVPNTDEKFLLQLEDAQRAFANVRKSSETNKLLKTNRNFHFLIYRQANAPILFDMIKQLWDKVSPYYHIMFQQAPDRSPTIGLSYHEKIVDGFRNNDRDAVKKWLHADLVDSTAFIQKLFDSYNLLS